MENGIRYRKTGPFFPMGLLFDGSLPVIANDSLKQDKDLNTET